MKLVAYNDAKVELDSTSAIAVRNVARKVLRVSPAFRVMISKMNTVRIIAVPWVLSRKIWQNKTVMWFF